jgi:hypothetical protein
MADQSSSLLPDPSTYPVPPPSAHLSVGQPGVKNWMIGFHQLGFVLWQPYDTHDMLLRIYSIADELGQICARGDLELLKTEIEKLRATDEAPFNRPSVWLWLSCAEKIWRSAYEARSRPPGPWSSPYFPTSGRPLPLERPFLPVHWHVIEYLVKDLGFGITPPLQVLWDLPTAVADRAAETGSTEELQRLLYLRWDINLWTGHSPYNFWLFGGLPTLTYVVPYSTS